VSVFVRVEGADAATVTTAIAIETLKGRPFRAMVGAQVETLRPRPSLSTSVVDTTLGQGGVSDAR
jgi:hypothetical protein